MELKLTNEEVEAIKYYKEKGFTNINQLLITDSRADIEFLNDEKNEGLYINYDESSVVNYIEIIKLLYSAMLKTYLSKEKKESCKFIKNSTITEIEKYKNEPYIDGFLFANIDKDINEEIDSDTLNNIKMCINVDENIPYMKLNEVLNDKSRDVLISLFTKVKEISEGSEINLNNKTIRVYTLKLEKQDLQDMTDSDKTALYNYIISNSDLVSTTLSNTVRLEKENISNYESIRELEKQISDMELEINRKEMGRDYSESAKNADDSDLKELKEKLEVFKVHSANIFDNIKSNNKFITNWKKNITVYLMAECYEIENDIKEQIKKANISKEEEFQNFARIKKENLATETFENILKEVKAECQDNTIVVNTLLNDINRLITRQQNFAKIAGNLGASYSALNNAFKMKSQAEELQNLIDTIKLKVKSLEEEKNTTLSSRKLLDISDVNDQIGILMNYLNNPKTSIAKSRMNRFDEMIVVEENELKRDIAKAILDIRGEAELKKLKDDTQIIESKGPLKRFIGIFTGQNKMDAFMLEQIEVRQNSIKKTLAKKLRLDYNYSVHELMAEIKMFIRDNEDDELVEEDISELRGFEKEISKNFVIIESKVQDIIDEKENKNLPVDSKITKNELIEIETYRFLNKYGYDIADKQEPEEILYVDTTANEIAKIVEYINTSKVLD
ncbi:MAG: hypothetical protein HFJ45_04085 [Clostridia bacterium]|nr:hypothetical protein [Clostridia bacterium]